MICRRNLLAVAVGAIILSGCSVVQKSAKAKLYSADKSNLEQIEQIKPIEQDSFVNIEEQVFKISKSSANNYQLNTNKSLAVTISESGYTRFSIEDERITDVFVYPQENIQVQIHQQGYLIIVPKTLDLNNSEDEDIPNPVIEKIYVTITGEQGTTQDFSLFFTGKAPEPVGFFK